MTFQKISSAVSGNNAAEFWQAQKICHGFPALLDIIFKQPISRYYSPNVFIVLEKALFAFLFVVVLAVAKMIPDKFVVSAPSAAKLGIRMSEYLPRGPPENGEESLVHRSQPFVGIPRVEDDFCFWIGLVQVLGEEAAWDVEHTLEGDQ